MKIFNKYLVISCLLCCIPTMSHAQVEAVLAIGAIRDAISSSIKDLQTLAVATGGEVKGAGNQLQANAQNVIRDIDNAFKGNLTLTWDRMDKQQQALYRDAQALMSNLKNISDATIVSGGEEARRALLEADILAYNTSYNLPCRNQIARLVYVTPSRIRAEGSSIEFTIRGNYLSNGNSLEMRIAGKAFQPISVNQGEIKGRINLSEIGEFSAEKSIPIELKTNNTEKSNLFVFGCSEIQKPGSWQSTSITLMPSKKVVISAAITPTAQVLETRPMQHRFDTGKPSDCSINQDVSRQICSADGWTVKSFSLENISVNGGCGSTAGPASASGSTCVHIPGRVQGCGWGFGLLGLRDCKGHGWVSWNLNVVEQKSVRKRGETQNFSVSGARQVNFTFRYQKSDELDTPQWSYIAKIMIDEGTGEKIYEISNANNNSGPIVGRMIGDTLSISIE